MTCADVMIALGSYVLDALDPRERAEIDSHLRTCEACRSELAELSTLPPLLARLSLQDLGESLPTIAVPDALFDKVVASVRDQDGNGVVLRLRRHRARAFLAAAAAVAIIAGGVTTAVEVTGGRSANVHSVASGAVHMQVTLSSQATGTALQVAVSGLPREEHCWLVAVSDDGTRDSVGRWVATYDGEAKVTGSTSIPVSELSRLILFGTDGTPLVTLAV